MSDASSPLIRSLSRALPWIAPCLVAACLAGPGPSAAQAPVLRLQPAQVKALGVMSDGVSPAGEAAATLSGLLGLPVSQQQLVVSPLDGLVTAVLVDEGDVVRAGQPLLRLRSAQLSSLLREQRQAESLQALAERGLQRDEKLLAEGLIPASRLDQARHDVQVARLAARQQRQLMGQVLDGASMDGKGELVIQATGAQQVLSRTVELGQRVDAATPLLKLGRLGEFTVDVQVPSAMARLLEVGRPVWVRQGEGPESQGRVTSVGGRVSEGNQTVLIKAMFKPAPDARLRPGQWVSVRLQTRGRSHLVAEAALVSLPQGGEGVFLDQGEGRYSLQAVQVLGREPGRVWVSGLVDGAKVVVRGTAALKALLP